MLPILSEKCSAFCFCCCPYFTNPGSIVLLSLRRELLHFLYFSRRIVRKIPKLQKDQKELLEEWKDRSSRFDKSLKKTEEKLKEQISIGREVTIGVMCALPSKP